MSRNSWWRLENLHVASVCVCVLGFLLFALAKPGALRWAIKALFDSEESKQILHVNCKNTWAHPLSEHEISGLCVMLFRIPRRPACSLESLFRSGWLMSSQTSPVELCSGGTAEWGVINHSVVFRRIRVCTLRFTQLKHARAAVSFLSCGPRRGAGVYPSSHQQRGRNSVRRILRIQ